LIAKCIVLAFFEILKLMEKIFCVIIYDTNVIPSPLFYLKKETELVK
jgi:hypothetical protein